jgi:hypothetical protein
MDEIAAWIDGKHIEDMDRNSLHIGMTCYVSGLILKYGNWEEITQLSILRNKMNSIQKSMFHF